MSYYKKRTEMFLDSNVNIHKCIEHIHCATAVSKPEMPWQVDCYVMLSTIHRHITRNQFKVPCSTASELANSQIEPIHAHNICEMKTGKLSKTTPPDRDYWSSKKTNTKRKSILRNLSCNLHWHDKKKNYRTRITRGINRNFKPYPYNFFFQSNKQF